ncbi:MAG: serine/threonine-protein phosphatase [Firmicutes bacterium]|nr:serine/threonine-protein phosphatase [Bacillota bacterium]
MDTVRHFIDVSTHSLNKYGEELCGDKVEIYKSEDKTIIVLADGLGSGVKANILATLTSKIAITMLSSGEDIEETISTIVSTLPVCNVRKIAYSTFSIVEIDKDLNCRLIECDNPPVFFIRNGRLLKAEKEEIDFGYKKVQFSSLKLSCNDVLTVCSDGVIHAGVGNILNHGWEWKHVADFLQRQHVESAEKYNLRLIETCNQLYGKKPGDDTTAVTVKIRKPRIVNIFSGPPENQDDDSYYVKEFMNTKGLKVVCGGTAANIFSRELAREIITTLDYIDPKIPPIAKIKGLDLVTEGVLTLQHTLLKLKDLSNCCEEPRLDKNDGSTLLLKTLIEDCTHVNFWIGKAINPAHQNPDFPAELSIKFNILNELGEVLLGMGKEINRYCMKR